MVLLSGCGRKEPSPDLRLTLRQIDSDFTTVEVVVGDRRLDVSRSKKNAPVEKRAIAISVAESEELRRLFWHAWRNQPETRHVPRIMDGVLLEQWWRGPERSWRVSIRGALTSEDRAAFERLNAFLPPPNRFAIDFGSHRQRD
jgi:hypothetical protein